MVCSALIISFFILLCLTNICPGICLLWTKKHLQKQKVNNPHLNFRIFDILHYGKVIVFIFFTKVIEIMRKRIFEIIEVATDNDKASRFYDVFMMSSIIISLLPLCTKSEAKWTITIDMITVVIFIADYLLRLFTADFKYPELKGAAFIRYPFSFMAIIDLLSIFPSFGVLNPGLKIFKILRLVRTLRVLKSLKALKTFRALKFFRYSRSVEMIVEVIKSQKEPLITVGGMAVGYILIAALIVFNVEPESFHTFFDAVYWACVSLTTVGYGDIYPVSTAGRIVTMLSSVVGIAIVALPSGIITAGYMDALQNQKDSEE